MRKIIEGNLCTWQNIWGDCLITTSSQFPSLCKLKRIESNIVKPISHEIIRTLGNCVASNPEEQRKCTHFWEGSLL